MFHRFCCYSTPQWHRRLRVNAKDFRAFSPSSSATNTDANGLLAKLWICHPEGALGLRYRYPPNLSDMGLERKGYLRLYYRCPLASASCIKMRDLSSYLSDSGMCARERGFSLRRGEALARSFNCDALALLSAISIRYFNRCSGFTFARMNVSRYALNNAIYI